MFTYCKRGNRVVTVNDCELCSADEDCQPRFSDDPSEGITDAIFEGA